MDHDKFVFVLATAIVSLTFTSQVQVGEAHVGSVVPGVIHSCVTTKNGALRIVGASDTCKPGEIPVDWNAVGPQGPIGLTGATGAQGPVKSPNPCKPD